MREMLIFLMSDTLKKGQGRGGGDKRGRAEIC